MGDRRARLLHRGAGGDEQEILNTLDETTITVRIAGHQPDRARQILAVALVDLLGRVVPRIDVQCSRTATTAPGLPPGPSGNAAQRLASADPAGSSSQISHDPPHTAEAARRLPGRVCPV